MHERSFTLIECDEEKYMIVLEAANRLNISCGTCYSNMPTALTARCFPRGRRPVHKQPEVEELSQVRVAEKQAQPLTLMEQKSVEVRKAAL